MSAVVCARCGVPATARVRWFVLGRSLPMFDVCVRHQQAELDVAALLNHGKPVPEHRVRVTELPEQLAVTPLPAGELDGLGFYAALALRLYRSCRERDFRPWEALDYVEAELLRAARIAGAHGERTTALGWQAAAGYLVTCWRPTVERWRIVAARQADETDRLLHPGGLLADLERALGGLRVKVDPGMPENVAEFRHADGSVAVRMTLNPDGTVARNETLQRAAAAAQNPPPYGADGPIGHV